MRGLEGSVFPGVHVQFYGVRGQAGGEAASMHAESELTARFKGCPSPPDPGKDPPELPFIFFEEPEMNGGKMGEDPPLSDIRVFL